LTLLDFEQGALGISEDNEHKMIPMINDLKQGAGIALVNINYNGMVKTTGEKAG
jgi:hypothetical protein